MMFAIAAVLLNFDAAFACNTKAKAYVAMMKSDLRNLVSAQESFFADSQRYTNNLPALGFKNSTGVSSTFDQITDRGWAATASHSASPAVCRIYVGERPARVPANVGEGEPWCDQPHQALWSNEELGNLLGAPTWMLLLALSLAAGAFLKVPGRANWGTRALAATLAVYTLPFVGLAQCGTLPFGFVAVFLALGATAFLFALRRRITIT